MDTIILKTWGVISTVMMMSYLKLPIVLVAWFFARVKTNLTYMRDIILSVALIAGTYACSMGFAIVVFRLFFPLKKKEFQPHSMLTLTYSKNKISIPTKSKIQLASFSGRR